MNHKIRLQHLFLILLLTVFSLGAWWDFGKPKKEEPKKEQPSFLSQLQQQFGPKKDQPAKQAESESQGTAPEFKAETLEGDLPPSVEAANVQKELSEIIDRTSKLQDQVKDNRAEVLQIMERAKIHENILKTIKVPQPVATPVKVVDAEAIVQREKLRLIAEQTKRAQEQLEIIQRTRSLESQRT